MQHAKANRALPGGRPAQTAKALVPSPAHEGLSVGAGNPLVGYVYNRRPTANRRGVFDNTLNGGKLAGRPSGSNARNQEKRA